MSNLSTGDKFLINRNEGTDVSPNWKSYQVDFNQLALDLSGEITIDIPTVGYTDDISEIENTSVGKLKFTSETNGSTPTGGADMVSIDTFLFHSSQREVLKGKKDEEIEVYNQETTDSVVYTLSEDAKSVKRIVNSVEQNFLQLKVVYKEGSGTLNPGNAVTIRPLTVISGGGSINIGNCPPGMKEDVNGNCVEDSQYGEIEEGTLWFNPMVGILYIWYENTGATSGDGQWVDVRPGGGGGGGVTGDYLPLGSWNVINDLSLAP